MFWICGVYGGVFVCEWGEGLLYVDVECVYYDLLVVRRGVRERRGYRNLSEGNYVL